MELKEAKEILEENGFILEGAYKEILHQKFAAKRAQREQDDKDYEARHKKMARLAKKMSKEIEEFISDLADEMVSDKVTCKYESGLWRTSIQVENHKYRVDTYGYGEIEFRKEDGGDHWKIIYSTRDLDNLDYFLEKVFDYITEEAA